MIRNSPLLNPRKLSPLVVIAAALLAYHNSFTGAFLIDDTGSISENATIRHLWPIWQCLSPPHRGGLTVEGRPLINLSLAINYALGGYNVWGYHALNLTVHILAGLTLLGIVRRTLLQPALRGRLGAAANELALATAVLWTVHPLQTESVTYIIQRAESIMGLFYLLTLYCFIRGAGSQRAPLWYGLSVCACALGMASKEVMVSAPVMVMLYDRAFLSDSFRKAWRRRWLLYLGLSTTWILLGFLVVSAGSFGFTSANARLMQLTWWEYLATQPAVILHYLRLCVWPSPLCSDHGWPIASTWMSILPPTAVVAILLAATAWAWRRHPSWGFVGAWFFLILAPSSSFIPLQDLIHEHRMYLPLAAVVSLVVMGLYSAAGRHSSAVFVAAAIGLGGLTWRRNLDYRNEITIRTDAVTKFPDDPVSHYNLGVTLAELDRVPEAIRQYERALQIKPGFAWAHYNLGIALMRVGRVRDAIAQYEQAVRLTANTAEARWHLGNALREAGKVTEAIGQYELALRLKPDFAQAHNNLGVALAQTGQLQEATEHYERAAQLDPGLADARSNLGTILLHEGRLQAAIGQYERALRIEPDNAQAHFNLGVALEQAGKQDEAIHQYQQALRINPDFAQAHDDLGNTLFEAGQLEAAIEQYRQALRVDPDYADAHNNLGGALLRLGRVEEAIGHFQEAVRIVPGMVEAHYNLGVALERAGHAEEAIKHYEQVLRLKPDYADARARLARLRPAP